MLSMKRAALFSGLLVLLLVWGGPLLTTWRESFAAHMLAHMGVVAVAAPLIAIGLSDQPVRLLRHPLLASPLVASLIDLVAVWVWHAPVLRAAVAQSAFVGVLEQASFLLAGLILWLSCLGTTRDRSLLRGSAGAFGLLFTSVHMTLLGALLTLSPRPLYAEGEVSCFGLVLSAGRDQEIGGVMMLLIGAAVYLAGGLALLGGVLRHAPQKGGAG
jgi:putative membrane protein